MERIHSYLTFSDFPNIGQNPRMHQGSPTVIGTRLKVSTVVRAYRACNGDLACVVETHPVLRGRPELIQEAMAFYSAYPDLVDPELHETYEEYVACLHRLGFEIRADGRVVLRPDRPVVNL